MMEKQNSKSSEEELVPHFLWYFLSAHKKRDLVASNTFINDEIEAIKSEVPLNCPVDIKRRRFRDKVKKSSF